MLVPIKMAALWVVRLLDGRSVKRGGGKEGVRKVGGEVEEKGNGGVRKVGEVE